MKKSVSKKASQDTYVATVGRRKEAVARVRLYKGSGFEVNSKEIKDYFPDEELSKIVFAPLYLIGDNAIDTFKVTVRVTGGGKRGQAEAIRLGLARALQTHNKDYRSLLKKAGYLKRDPRAKERKKYGLKRARRAPQFSKR
jgi:small subunit ribosomal protein S9